MVLQGIWVTVMAAYIHTIYRVMGYMVGKGLIATVGYMVGKGLIATVGYMVGKGLFANVWHSLQQCQVSLHRFCISPCSCRSSTPAGNPEPLRSGSKVNDNQSGTQWLGFPAFSA